MGTVDLDSVRVFARVVESGSFTQAARQLGMPKSSVSRNVSRLESELGVRLLQRTTRTLSLTDAGDAFYDRVAPALAAIREAGAEVGELVATPRGSLRVTAPPDAGAILLAPLVAQFVAKYPEVTIETVLTGRNVDLVSEGFDLAVRAGKLSDSSLVARKLGDVGAGVFATRSYLDKHGTPRTPAALAKHRAVLFRAPEGRVRWELSSSSGTARVDVQGNINADDFLFVKNAMLADAGIALLPKFLCAADVASERVVRLVPRWERRDARLSVVYPSARFLPQKVAAFRDFLVEQLAPPLSAGVGADGSRG